MKMTTRLFLILLAAVVLPLPVHHAAQREDAASIMDREPGVVRIGISGDPVKRRVYARGGIVVRDPVDRKPVWKRRFTPGVYFVSDNSTGRERMIYRVQIASFESEELAVKKQEELEAVFPDEKVVLAYHPDRRTWRVRIGEARTREETSPLVQRLTDEGYTELWVTEEGEVVSGKKRIRLVDDQWDDFLSSHDRVLIEPVRPDDLLRIGEDSYRGTLEAMINRSGNLRLINVIDMEQYLRGVVPNEMGPGVYPELEALKAQAVAARTYIVANLGQFSEDGYDICDTPSCQVYRGAETEHPLTDQALEETLGVVLMWDGEPINAMYTSTCGGHTEDGHLVFQGEKGPYLKGVTCYPEADAEAQLISADAWRDSVVLEDGSAINEEIHLLQRLGVVGPEAFNSAYLLSPCGNGEAVRWVGSALRVLGKKPSPRSPEGEELILREFAAYLVRSLSWQERMRIALDDRDLPYLLAFEDWDSIADEFRRPYATLLREGIFRPFADNTLRPGLVPSRGLVLLILYRMLDYYEGLGRARATYRGFDNGSILLEVGEEVTPFTMAPGAALFRSFRDIPYPTDSLPLTLGDRLLYRQGDDATIDYLKLLVRDNGVSNDRYSSLYRWEERVTREDLEARIRSRIRIGRLIDIEPVRRGVSGRVVELKVRGSRGVYTLRGFRIRTALGIRETNFTVDRTFTATGQVDEYIFSGKGWGHGVGLCQVGAYGMAVRGKNYEEILRHYYNGADLTVWDGVTTRGDD
jgi:stage II sporulation protein D